MATTSTAVNACNASLWLDDVSGTPRDISGSSNSIDVSLDHNLGEVLSFGSKWPKRLECGKDATVTIEVIYSETASEGWDVLKDWYFATAPGARTLTFYIPDKNVGSDKFETQARLESLSWTADRGEAGPIMVSATLRPDGELTHSDVAT